MRVLVVEDSKMSRRMIVNALKNYNYTNVVEAENGEDGLDKLAGANLIITDWNMPIMEGLEFVKKVRARSTNIPMLMISTNNADREIEEALENGVDDYIVKPFFPEDLKAKLDAVLQKYNISNPSGNTG
ncbi:MAG: response regulator [bacterium]|nr:response regulator [bacterium]